MSLLNNPNLLIHILAGALTLIAGPIALFYHDNSKLHRLAGKVFFFAMLAILATSMIGFFKHYDKVFFQFILGLSLLVAYNLTRGVRAIQLMKKKTTVGAFERNTIVFGWLIGICMLGIGIYHASTGQTHIAIPVLFSVFGTLAILDARRFTRQLKQSLNASWWLRIHTDSMFGAFIASNTAFLVNAGDFLPWYLQWFLPTILLIPIQLYLRKKRKLDNVSLRKTIA